MSRTVYVNGRYQPYADAAVHVEDRGFQFADGVYEVIAIVGGRLVDADGHLDRLDRSLGELRIAAPVSRRVLGHIIAETARRNRVRVGSVYIQITRGAARRDFRFPAAARPSLVVIARPSAVGGDAHAEGAAVITRPDIRWLRRDIKSVALLPQVLAKQAAVEAGAFEAWQLDPDGTVTEGASSNAWIVTADGALVTRPASNLILNGITRQRILRLAAEEGLSFTERPFSLAEALAAREAFVSSATSFLVPVVSIDGKPVGDGRPGPFARRMRALYLDHAGRSADSAAEPA